jgi:hypothetical protein
MQAAFAPHPEPEPQDVVAVRLSERDKTIDSHARWHDVMPSPKNPALQMHVAPVSPALHCALAGHVMLRHWSTSEKMSWIEKES